MGFDLLSDSPLAFFAKKCHVESADDSTQAITLIGGEFGSQCKRNDQLNLGISLDYTYCHQSKIGWLRAVDAENH